MVNGAVMVCAFASSVPGVIDGDKDLKMFEFILK